MTEEHRIQNEIRAAVSEYCIIFRMNVGKGYTMDGRWFSSGVPAGFSDLFGVRKSDGRAVFIEVKTPKGRPTREQKHFLEQMRAAGAVAGICRSAEEAVGLVKEEKEHEHELERWFWLMALTIFAERMKQARTDVGMKQNELAKAIGVTPATISAYEKASTDGNGKNPTLENAQKIAKVLGVSLDWVCGNGQPTPDDLTSFSLQDYLKSIAIALSEMNVKSEYDKENGNATIHIDNPAIALFATKVQKLLFVHRSGTLTREMYNDCIKRLIFEFNGKDLSSVSDCCKTENCKECADVAPVIHATNLSAVAWCDKLICSHCGIVLQDWVEVRYDEDMDDTSHYEYVFNYCPNCGAKIEEVEEHE